MRMLLKFNIPIDAGNAAIKNGDIPKKLQQFLAEVKPEAAYFAEECGQRTGYIFFDMKSHRSFPPSPSRSSTHSTPT